MGVLTDYFRAPDDASVLAALERTDGGSPAVGPPPVLDGVEGKGMDPGVVLGQLVAAIRRVPWDVDLVDDTPLFDPEDAVEGPWTMRLDDGVRDTLADVPDSDLPRVAAEWAEAEELAGADPEFLRDYAEELAGLARRARDNGEHLYCWICL